MKLRYSLFAGILAMGLTTGGLAYGQQPGQPQNSEQESQQLSNRDARQFMQRLEREINQTMQSRNVSRLHQLVQNAIGDNAVLSGTRQINTNGQSGAFLAATMTKQDLLRLQRHVLSIVPDSGMPSQDFNLSIRVTSVQPIGDAAALVKSRVTESSTFGNQQAGNQTSSDNQQFSRNQQFSANPEPFTEGAGNSQEGQGQPRFAQRRNQQGGVQLETQANCTHLLERNQSSGSIQIMMGICNGETESQ